MEKENLSVSEVAKIFDVSVRTVQRWDNNGYLPAKRTQSGRRFYSLDQVIKLKNIAAKGTDYFKKINELSSLVKSRDDIYHISDLISSFADYIAIYNRNLVEQKYSTRFKNDTLMKKVRKSTKELIISKGKVAIANMSLTNMICRENSVEKIFPKIKEEKLTDINVQLELYSICKATFKR